MGIKEEIMVKLKRKLVLLVSAILAVSIAVSLCAVTAFAAGGTDKFDGQTNLATDASLWNRGAKTDSAWYFVGENGIGITEYGAGSAPTALSLKELLPHEGVLQVTFNSDVNPAGYLKMVFADNSGSTNGLAMKPWEISGKAEHVALEINNNGIFLWHYNKGNEYPNASQLGVNNATVNYIDGNDHVIKVEYKAEESAYKLKLTIDETVHYDNTLTTSKLFVNNVLTLGGYGNNKVDANLAIKSVTIEKLGEEPTPVIDANNLLGKADKWTVSENATLDETAATLTANGITGSIAELKDVLPAEAIISMKAELLDVPTEDTHKGMIRFRILSNDVEEVVMQIDGDGNVWLMHIDKVNDDEILASSGEWFPGLLAGLNAIQISITPEFDADGSDVLVVVSSAAKNVGLVVENLDLVTGNHFEVIGMGVGGIKITEIKVDDMVKEKSDSALTEKDLIKDASGWSYVSSSISDDKIELGQQDFLQYTKELPAEGEFTFTIKGTADCNSWYYLGFGNFKSTLWDGEEVTAGQNRFRITTTGTQGFYTIGLSDGSAVSKKTPDTTMLFDGTNQTFTWKTEKADGGLKITLTRNGIEEFSNVYASDTALGSSKGFYLMFRATGAHNANPVITDVKSTVVEKVDVAEYNAAIAIKRAIYALDKPTEENATTIKENAAALIENLTDEQRKVVNNELYATYIIEKADAIIAAAADKAAAKIVSDKIEALKTTYATITADNVEAAKNAVEEVKAAYAALTDAQKGYVTNYGDVETVEIAIGDYENSLPENVDKAAAKVVSDKIETLKTTYATITADNVEAAKKAVKEVKSDYVALTSAQKNYVTNYGDVETVEKAISAYEKGQQGGEKSGCLAAVSLGGIFAVATLLGAAILVLKKRR